MLWSDDFVFSVFFFQAEDGIRDIGVTEVQTCALPIAPDGFLGANNTCDNAGRSLPTMAQLDRFLRGGGSVSDQGEWTSSVYRNTDNGMNPSDQLEAVLLNRDGVVSYDRVYLAVQHAFRCVALPSN